jgi:tagatose 1,6-diphosphate aldolase
MPHQAMTIGKLHRLHRCSTDSGQFAMLALDHRNSLKRSFNSTTPDSVPFERLAGFKRAVVSELSLIASAILLDPEYGLKPALRTNAIARGCGLVVAVERSGYAGSSQARRSEILPGWNVGKTARVGGDAVKLLVHYHPEAPNVGEQEALVQQVAESCWQHDIPFFLEPLTYSLDLEQRGLSSTEKRAVVVKTAAQLTPMGVDVLKAEFPLDIATEPNETVWEDACVELSQASACPWVLLSAGVSFDDFERQTVVACNAGASGVLAGRAVWKEAVGLTEGGRQTFLAEQASARMERLTTIVNKYGRPYTDIYPKPDSRLDMNWYFDY